MTSQRDLLPGNADLAEIASQVSRRQRDSSSDVGWMLAVSIVLTTVGLIAASKFSVLYRELGVQLPARSEEAMLLWFHLVALAMLLLPIVWRLRAGATSWATPVWFVSALFYVGYVILVLFMPLVGAMGVLGEQINPG